MLENDEITTYINKMVLKLGAYHMAKTIKFIQPKLQLHEKIAVVGSSDRLLDTKYGAEIDSFDEVVRFNRSVIDGYEEFVGSKTTLRVVNAATFQNSGIDPKNWPGHDIDFIAKTRNTRILFSAPLEFENVWEEGCKKLHPTNSPFRTMKILEVQEYFDCITISPSVGLTFVLLAIYSGLKPYLFGFDTEVSGHRGHYWSVRPPPGGCHDFSTETDLLKRLYKEEKIYIHT